MVLHRYWRWIRRALGNRCSSGFPGRVRCSHDGGQDGSVWPSGPSLRELEWLGRPPGRGGIGYADWALMGVGGGRIVRALTTTGEGGMAGHRVQEHGHTRRDAHSGQDDGERW